MHKKEEAMEEVIVIGNISEEIKEKYYEYGMYAIQDRAIPNIYDNMKPVQRKILATMWRHGINNAGNYKKCARIIGLTTALSVHGDKSIYDAMVKMAQDFKNNVPKIDWSGIYGSIDGSAPAAPRYTEARLSEYAEQVFLKDLSKDTVEWEWNYDETEEEPLLLPAVVPDLLINGNNGIAVGYSMQSVPHNPREITELLIAYVQNRTMTLKDMLGIVKGPDFPTGGVINGMEGMIHAYETGKGSCASRGEVVKEIRNGRECVVITSIPFQSNTTTILENIVKVGDSKVIHVRKLDDNSSRSTGIRIILELEKDENYDRVVNFLYKKEIIQSNIQVNYNVLDDRKLITVGLVEIIRKFVGFREDIIHKKLLAEMRRNADRIHIIDGIIICHENVHEVVDVIRKSSGREDAKTKLRKLLPLSDVQASHIVDLRLYRLANLEIDALMKEKKTLGERNETLAIWTKTKSNIHIDKLMIAEWKGLLQGVFKDCHRKTVIQEKAQSISVVDIVKEEDLTVVTTMKNFVKVFPGIQDTTNSSVWGLDTDDSIRDIIHVKSTDGLVFVMDTGHVFSYNAYQLVPLKGTRGKLIRNIIEAKPYSNISSILVTDRSRNVCTVTSDGFVKTTSMLSVEKISSAGRVLHQLDKGSTIVSSFTYCPKSSVVVVSKQGQGIRFSLSDIRVSGLGAQGVRAIRLRDGDTVCSAMEIEKEESDFYLLSATGCMKHYASDIIRNQSRGGFGVTMSPLGPNVGELVQIVDAKHTCYLVVKESKELISVPTLKKTSNKGNKWESPIGIITDGGVRLCTEKNYIPTTVS